MTKPAKGPGSGYIYQFEVALWELSGLDENQLISIESIDDVAKINNDGTYICSIQAKHSICISGKSFGNTSEDLWKTINIWIENIKSGKLNSENTFKAISNKGVPKNSILHKIKTDGFEKFVECIENLLKEQESKLEQKKLKNENGNSIQKTINRINTVLSNKNELKTICESFELLENQNQLKNEVYNKLNLGGYSEDYKENFYQNLLGWLQDKCKDFWIDGREAIFSKNDFDLKWNFIRDNNLLKKLLFRTKEDVAKSEFFNQKSISKNRLFIKQIEDIERHQKEDIIEDAIVDFLCRDIEMSHLLNNSSLLTREDFLNFEENCLQIWRKVFRSKITRSNISSYSDEEIIDKAIEIYDEIMLRTNLDFQDSFGFKDSNRYIQNGTFLSLSDKPLIGWHVNWQKKYSNEE